METLSGDTAADQPSSEEMSRFLKSLRRLVLDEAATVRQNVHQVWSKPIATRVSEGRAIEGLRIVDIQPNGFIELACDRNSSRFREGDILCLNRGNPFAEPSDMVTLEVDDETALVVSSQDLVINWGQFEREPLGWILDEGYIDLSHWILDALNEAGDTITGRTQILPLLMGYARPKMDASHHERGLAMGEALELNYGQTEALAQAYAADLTYLIQGPPGTGKTRLLAHRPHMPDQRQAPYPARPPLTTDRPFHSPPTPHAPSIPSSTPFHHYAKRPLSFDTWKKSAARLSPITPRALRTFLSNNPLN